MKIEYEHGLTKIKVYEKLNSLLPQLKEKYINEISNVHSAWNDNKDYMSFSFDAKGFTLEGSMAITDNIIIIEGKVPFLARPFQGIAESRIKSQLEEIFNVETSK